MVAYIATSAEEKPHIKLLGESSQSRLPLSISTDVSAFGLVHSIDQGNHLGEIPLLSVDDWSVPVFFFRIAWDSYSGIDSPGILWMERHNLS